MCTAITSTPPDESPVQPTTLWYGGGTQIRLVLPRPIVIRLVWVLSFITYDSPASTTTRRRDSSTTTSETMTLPSQGTWRVIRSDLRARACQLTPILEIVL